MKAGDQKTFAHGGVRTSACRLPSVRAISLALLFSCIPAFNVAHGDVTWQPTAEAALRIGAAEKKVTVVYFTASWCGFCRKMTAQTFPDPAVAEWAPRFVWAKVDTDEEPLTAARYGIRSLPTIILLNVEGQVIAGRAGFMTAAQLAGFLQDAADKAEAQGALIGAAAVVEATRAALAKLEAGADAVQVRQALAPLLDRLADAGRTDREELLEGVIAAKEKAWPGLLLAMADHRLSHRAAAGGAMVMATKADLPFDPFADVDERAAQLEAWRTWLAARDLPVPAEVKPEPAPAPPTPPTEPEGTP